MKKQCLAIKCATVAMAVIGIAHADSSKWTGFYAGIDVGAVFNHAELTSQQLGFTSPSETCNLTSDFSTFSPGIQLGYMYQFAHAMVAGLEVNTTFNTNQTHTSSCESEFNADVKDSFTFKNQTQTSIKGRAGYAVNWNKNTFLPYLTVGASVANLGLKYENEGGDDYADTHTETGWLVGGGMEWSFKEHWSLRAEYNYVDYGNAINLDIPTVYGLFDENGEAQFNLKSNVVFVAISYWI